MKRYLNITLLTVLILTSGTVSARERLSFTYISEIAPEIPQYEMVEITCIMKHKIMNPFRAKLTAHIIDPDNEIIAQPGFLFDSPKIWLVRFTPMKKGKYQVNLSFQNGKKTIRSETYSFISKDPVTDGFIRVQKGPPFIPLFDSGKPFIGIGHNIAWAYKDQMRLYKRYFENMAKNGCNLTRVWINTPWSCPIEDAKIGKYALDTCVKVDKLLELAKEYDIYIILVLDTYGSLMEEPGYFDENIWSDNVYNKKNGGPCEKPWDFFIEPKAIKCYKDRIEYVLSRWGYSTNIMAFELWNEVDTPVEWISEITTYINSVNTHKQAITVSLGYPWDNDFAEGKIFGHENIDIVQHHIYGNQSDDMIGEIISTNHTYLKLYNKPILVGEFGIDCLKSDKYCDPKGKGLCLHNSLWASIMSGSFSSALNWWWDDYIFPKNVYSHYAGIRKYINSFDPGGRKFTPINEAYLKIPVSENNAGSYRDLSIKPKKKWGETRFTEFSLSQFGDLDGGFLNHYLQGNFHKHMKVDQSIDLEYPAAGKFIVDIGMVSQGGTLSIMIDGKEALTREFPCGPGDGPWKKSLYLKKHKVYQCVYNTSVSVDVPSGRHKITLRNTGIDWIGLKKITFGNFISNSIANARVVGLKSGDLFLIWIQDKKHGWLDDKNGNVPEPIKNSTLVLRDVPPGDYNIQWWDTHKGKVIQSEIKRAAAGSITPKVPDFTLDIACIIKRL